jgi:hypothetical protein
MRRSMAFRRTLAAAVLLALGGCGADQEQRREVRVLAPADLLENAVAFERRTGCRVDRRPYDEGEDLATIARRRDVDVVAAPVPRGTRADDSVQLVTIRLAHRLEITVPKRSARAFDGTVRPAGSRRTRWVIRNEGDNPHCARLWVAYATSQ